MPPTPRLLVPLLPGRKLSAKTEPAGVPPDAFVEMRKAAHVPGVEIDPAHGAPEAATLDAFVALAARDDVPGAPRVLSVKILMTGVGEPCPVLYLMQTNRFEYHYDFAIEALGMEVSLEEFNARTYFRDKRDNLAGSLLYHESYMGPDGQKSLVTLEFWPTDPVHASLVGIAFQAVEKALPFAKGRVAYHPAGTTQENLFRDEAQVLADAGVRSISSAELFANVTFTPMNLGVGFGTLRVVDPNAAGLRPPTIRDVVVFKSFPNDLSHVAGILTEAPQTPLSHINLKAKQNGTPNAYLKDAAMSPDVTAHLDQIVRFEVAEDGVHIAAATAEEVEAFLDSVRPKEPQSPPRDLTETHARPLVDLRFADSRAFGAKAANVAELGKVLPRSVVPDGYALPFFFYDRFMTETGLYEDARAVLAEPSFSADPSAREHALSDLRKRIKKAKMSATLKDEIGSVQEALYGAFGPEQPIRARSSTNNEDLPGFNGAGLYDSYTHRPDEGHLESTVKQVFASLWNFRAFEERAFYRIDHFAAAMGVLLHPNEDDERANGVAYTKNIYDPNWPGFYINAQVGESLVTNPDPAARPEEFLISRIGEHEEYETQYISRSSLATSGEAVLATEDIARLVDAMEQIHPHFQALYGRVGDRAFALDIEFKIRKDGSLQIKQARPTVD